MGERSWRIREIISQSEKPSTSNSKVRYQRKLLERSKESYCFSVETTPRISVWQTQKEIQSILSDASFLPFKSYWSFFLAKSNQEQYRGKDSGKCTSYLNQLDHWGCLDSGTPRTVRADVAYANRGLEQIDAYKMLIPQPSSPTPQTLATRPFLPTLEMGGALS